MKPLSDTAEVLALAHPCFMKEAPLNVSLAVRSAVLDGAKIVQWTERSIVLRSVPEPWITPLEDLGLRPYRRHERAREEAWMTWRLRTAGGRDVPKP